MSRLPLHRPIAPDAPPAAPLAVEECRCACGSLLARLVDDAVELKCRRCKRTVRVPLVGPVDFNAEASGTKPRAQHAGGTVVPVRREDAGPCLCCRSSSSDS